MTPRRLQSAGIDVAIRTREQEPDSNIIVRRIGQMGRVLAASPSYLATHGRPEHPADLARHDMLIYNLANAPRRKPSASHPRSTAMTARSSGAPRLSAWGYLSSHCTSCRATFLPGDSCRC